MSVINKMLQELDQRQTPMLPEGSAVRARRGGVDVRGKGREAFWRLLAFLMLASMAWVAVLVYQLQVQPLVTNLAFKTAEDARARPAPPATPLPAPAAVVPIAEPGQAVPNAAPKLFQLAPSIQTPILAERERKPATGETRATVGAKRVPLSSTEASNATRPPETKSLPAESAASSGKVEKRDRPRTPYDQAEADFRRAVGLLNEGRNGDAQEALAVAIKADGNHEAARQALAALLLEQRKIEPARRLLQDGLAINPSNPVFASTLARILMESKEYDGALNALQGANAAGASRADYQALIGAVQQRLGHHREAMEAYQAALRLSSASGSSWMGLGISLEALGHRPEASEAFRRAIATESLTADLRGFAEARLRETKQ